MRAPAPGSRASGTHPRRGAHGPFHFGKLAGIVGVYCVQRRCPARDRNDTAVAHVAHLSLRLRARGVLLAFIDRVGIYADKPVPAEPVNGEDSGVIVTWLGGQAFVGRDRIKKSSIHTWPHRCQVQERICGVPEVDLDNLKRHTTYKCAPPVCFPSHGLQTPELGRFEWHCRTGQMRSLRGAVNIEVQAFAFPDSRTGREMWNSFAYGSERSTAITAITIYCSSDLLR